MAQGSGLESKGTIPAMRFTDKGDSTIVDNRTGLIWLRTPIVSVPKPGPMRWPPAAGCQTVTVGYQTAPLPEIGVYPQ